MADPVSLGIQVAIAAATMAMQMSRKIEGPRLDELNVTVADYGTPLNYFYGTRRFSGVPIIWAEPIREERKRRKTKGGKYNEYTYYGTWAVAVADHEIDSVTRIWFDKHLVYDVTGGGPVTPFVIGYSTTTKSGSTRQTNVLLTDHIRIYLGTETQEADPRMLATVEAQFGADSCPAYKGVSYIVFEDVPLEKFGNRIPQIGVEASRTTSIQYLYDVVDADLGTTMFPRAGTIDHARGRLYWFDDTDFEVWDLASRSLLYNGAASPSSQIAGTLAREQSGTILAVSAANDLVRHDELFFGPATFVQDFGILLQDEVRCLVDGNGVEHWGTIPDQVILGFYFDGVAYDPADFTGYSWQLESWFVDSHGDVWAAGTKNSSTAVFVRMVDTGARPGSSSVIEVSGLTGSSGSVQAIHYSNESVDQFVFSWGNAKMYAASIDDGSILATRATAANGMQLQNLAPNASSVFTSSREISLTDLTEIRTYDLDDWFPFDTGFAFYDPVNHAIITANFTNSVTYWRYLDRVTGGGTTLQDVVEDVSVRCGIDLADIITTDLTQELSYSWTQGSGRDVLEPLLDVYDCIVRPHDFGIEFMRLGDSSLGTLSVGDFVAGNNERARYDIKFELDTDLPQRVTVTYADLTADQQANAAMDQRDAATTDSKRQLSINLTTLALNPNEAQQLTERWLRRRWFSREGYVFALTAQELAIEPGDVFDVDFDGVEKRGRVVATKLEKRGVVNLEIIRDDPLVASLSASSGATMDGHADEVFIVAGPSKGFVFDTPLFQDVDSAANPLTYYGAGPYNSGAWLGASIFESDNGVDFDVEIANVPSVNALSWGFATSALEESPAHLWDRGAGFNVKMFSGSLVSITEAEANANPMLNRAMLGDEQIQFTVATLEADGSYTITGIKRGRRGTEWAVGAHSIGDGFVLIETLASYQRGASDISTNLYFKAVGPLEDASRSAPIPIAFEGRTLKPYAPAHLEAVKETSGDWTISWVRRTRIGGSWTGGGTIPLGETTEAYAVAILDGSDEVRVISITSETATYTDAQQVEDFGATVALGNLDLVAYQLSDIAGRGFGTAGAF